MNLQLNHEERDLEQALGNLALYCEHASFFLPWNYPCFQVTASTLLIKKEPPFADTFFSELLLFATLLFSRKKREEIAAFQRKIVSLLQRSSDVIRAQYLFLEKWKRGTEEEQKRAKDAEEIIENFNRILKESKKARPFWKSNVWSYVVNVENIARALLPIELPNALSWHRLVFKSGRDSGSQKITRAFLKHLPEPAVRAIDAFRLKAATLLKEHAFFEGILDAIAALREAPLKQVLDPTRKALELSQEIVPWPGMHVRVRGLFQQDLESKEFRIPVPSSFSLDYTLLKTGFPEPLQYTGCALSETVLPHLLQAPQSAAGFFELEKKRLRLIEDLKPGGKKVKQAKSILDARLAVFRLHQELFLTLQQTLFLAIAKQKGSGSNAVNKFFAALKKNDDPWIKLSEIFQIFNTELITQGFVSVQKAWLDKTPPFDTPATPKERKEEIEHFVKKASEIDPKHLADLSTEDKAFIKFLGDTLGSASLTLMLQIFSETIHFPPPLLSDFEQRVQAWAVKQLVHFLEDFEKTVKSDPAEHFKARIETTLIDDIELFSKDSFEDLEDKYPIPGELEAYFNTRFLLRNLEKKNP